MTQPDLFPPVTPQNDDWPTGPGWRCSHGLPINWATVMTFHCPQCLVDPGDEPREPKAKKKK